MNGYTSPRRTVDTRYCAFWVLALLLLPFHASVASTVLLPTPRRTSPEPVSVVTFAGPVQVTVAPVKPANSLTVVWLLDTLDSIEREQARIDLLALSTRMRNRPLRLALLHDGAIDLRGPFSTRAQIEHAAAEMHGPANVVPGPATLDALNQNAARLGAHWSPVLLVGKMPKLEPAVMEYAQALLAQTFAAQQLRMFLLAPAGDEAWSPLFESSGGAIVPDASSLGPLMDEASRTFLQVTWTAADPPGGFVVSPSVVQDKEGKPLTTLPDLVSAGGALPTIVNDASTQQHMEQVSAWLREETTAANLQRIRDVLLPAQAVNPVDPAVLQVEVTLGEKTQDYAYAVKAATLLTQVQPTNASAFFLLGQARVLAADFAGAETALNNAAALKFPADQLAEQYARVRLGTKDERGALPYLEAALHADAKRQDLWWMQAQAALDLHDSALAMRSFEQGLALGGVHADASGSLIVLYMEAKEPAKAQALAMHTVKTLPADAAVRTQFAETLDHASLPADALAAWQSVLEVQPGSERGHVRVAQLLLETGDRKGAEAAAGSSLQNLPKSAALYLAKSDAIQQQGRIYDARTTLEEGAAGTQDPAVLTSLAAAQEVYGDRAPEAYANLANKLGKNSPDRSHALERGFSLALRDGSLKQAAIFAALLEAEGHPEYRVLLGEKRAARYDAVVPGGLAAFGLIARVKPGTPPDRLFAEYARQVVGGVCSNCMGDHYSATIQSYFATIAELEGLGRRDGSRVSIALSLNGKEERKHTENVLRLLGLQMHTEKGQLRLDRGEKQSQGKKQDILTALDIDEVGMQDALKDGKPFVFEMHDESAAVYPSAKMWKSSFPKLDQTQFALMLLHAPLMARLYVGMSTLDRRTVEALIGNSGLYYFMGRSADLLSLYGTSFAVEGTHAAVPGGAAAESVWSQMVGVSTAKPGAFYQALLDQKSPSLLAFFYALSHLDPQHQAFLPRICPAPNASTPCSPRCRNRRRPRLAPCATPRSANS